ncbi:hypothetical protein DFH28DRAFT_1228497 [Melampsora americana]|nr:hypothetical protein DFH28DRAFT_1228497 [Melampsora americana]
MSVYDFILCLLEAPPLWAERHSLSGTGSYVCSSFAGCSWPFKISPTELGMRILFGMNSFKPRRMCFTSTTLALTMGPLREVEWWPKARAKKLRSSLGAMLICKRLVESLKCSDVSTSSLSLCASYSDYRQTHVCIK